MLWSTLGINNILINNESWKSNKIYEICKIKDKELIRSFIIDIKINRWRHFITLNNNY
jgi:hypothetical protein